MAITTEEVLGVDLQQPIESINTLRAAVKAAREEYNEAALGSKEYDEALAKLTKAQNELTNATRLGSKTIDESDQSYNALSRTMAELKQQWKATSDEAERDALGKKILDLNNRLKDLDASTGNFQRNVGDYKNAMVGAFTAVGGAAGGAIQPIANLTIGFKSLRAAGGWIGILIEVVFALVRAMKTSEEATNNTANAFAAFKAIGDLLTVVLQVVSRVLGWVGEKLSDLLVKLKLLKEESEERQRLQKEEIALVQQQRQVNEANAQSELNISELRAKAAEKLKYTAQERLSFLQQAADEEKAIAQRNLDMANRELKLLQDQAKLTENSKEDNDRLSQAKVKQLQAQTAYNNKIRELNMQMTKAQKEIINGEKSVNAELANGAKEAEKQTEANIKAQQELLKLQQQNRAATRENDLQTAQENYDQELAMFNARVEKEQIAQETANAIRLELEERFRQQKAEINQRYDEQEFDALRRELEQEMQLQDESVKQSIKNTAEEEKKKEEAEKRKRALTQGTLNITKSVLGSAQQLAGENSKAGKAMAIAGATIDTYQSANEAYKSMAGIPIIGPGLGAAAAAAAILAGIANVKNIMSVDPEHGTGGNIGAVSPIVNPPAVIQQVPIMRSLTSASEEERLNRLVESNEDTSRSVSDPQRVYVVYSDIAEAGRQVQVQQNESSF